MNAHRLILMLGIVTMIGTPLHAQFDSGSDRSDGLLFVSEDRTIDLALADRGPGHGQYDAEEWAVVFNYSAVIIQEGVTVTFANHRSGAPVIWLVQGDVTIEGTINIDGSEPTETTEFAKAGPGGFRGGREDSSTADPSAGFGPGGGRNSSVDSCDFDGSGAGYATVGDDIGSMPSTCYVPGGSQYGNLTILALIGGSGGAGSSGGSGGAGGGAILIASSGTITLNGSIFARGGDGRTAFSGSGSGGAVRFMADTIAGTGVIDATQGTNGHEGGEGRIRLEANAISFTGVTNPPPDFSTPTFVFPPGPVPTLRVMSINGHFMPQDPNEGITTTDLAIYKLPPEPSEVLIEAEHVPPGTYVTVRVVPEQGRMFEVDSIIPLQGTLENSTTTALVVFPAFIRSEIQLFANWDPTP